MKYLFFDIECSNCFNGIGKMCEFGYVLTDENFKIITKNEFPMSPGKGDDCRFHLRGRMNQLDIDLAYDYDFYYEQPEFPTFYERIKKLIEDENTVCFAWSSNNDMLHLYHSCTRYRKRPFKYICYDLQKMAGRYLEVKRQKGLKECCTSIVGKNAIVALQEHLSSDDAKMSMLIFEAICVLQKKTSVELLKESEYAKDDAYEFCINFEIKIKNKQLSHNNHEYYKKVALSDSGHIDEEKFIGKKINLSSNIKASKEHFKDFINLLHNAGYLIVNDLSITDLFVCLDENNLKEVEEKLKEKYKGLFVLLDSLNIDNK